MKGLTSQRVLEGGGLLVALLLPLYFNPLAALPFEPVKVTFFRWTVAAMAASTLLWVAYTGWCQRKRIIHLIRAWPGLSAFAQAGRRLQAGNPLAVLVLIYGAVYILATFASMNPGQSLWGLSDKHGAVTTWSYLLFFLLLAGALRTRAQIERIVTAVLLGSMPVSVYGIVQFLGFDPLNWVTDSVSPVLSTLGRSNFLGAYLVVVVPFTFHRLSARPAPQASQATVNRSLSAVSSFARLGTFDRGVAMVLVLQVTCLLLTQARAAWLAFVGGVSIYLGISAFHPRRRRTLLMLSSFWVASAAVFLLLNRIALTLPTEPMPRSSRPSFTELRSTSVDRRLVIWRSTLPLISDRWLLGYGPETFVTIFESHYPTGSLYAGSDAIIDDPHNLILDHLMSAGVLGLASFLGVIALFYLVILRILCYSGEQQTKTLAAALLSSVTAFLIQAQFNPDVIVLSVFFWLVLALSVALRRTVSSVRPNEPNLLRVTEREIRRWSTSHLKGLGSS